MKPYSVDLRRKIIEAYEKGDISQRQLAKRFGVTLSFIIKLFKQYRETGSLDPISPPGRPPRVTDEHEEFIKQLIAQFPTLTLKEIQQELEGAYGERLGTSTISRILKRLKLTRKKKSSYPQRKASAEVQEQRRVFRETVNTIEPERMIFIDESGVNLGMNLPYGRCESGQRLYSAQAPRGQNVSLCGGIRLGGLVGYSVILGAYDSLSFEAFLCCEIVPHLCPGDYVFMDNCSIHKGKMVEELIQSAGATLVYVSPYSPDFVPIENCWSKLKQSLCRIGARTYDDLLHAIEQAWSEITLENIKSWFTHCCYCTP